MKCDCHHEPGATRGSVRVTVSFDPDDLQLTHTPFGLLVKLADASSVGPIGGPALPQRLIRIAMPGLQWPTGLAVENLHFVPVTQRPSFVAPAQPLRPGTDAGRGTNDPADPCCCPPRPHEPANSVDPLPAPPVVPPDPALYERELREPRPLARALEIEQAGLARIARVELNPLRFSADSALELCTRFDIVITTSDSAPLADRDAALKEFEQRLGIEIDTARVAPLPAPVVQSAAHAKRLHDIALAEVVNPKLLQPYAPLWPRFELPCEYLVITDDRAWNETTMQPGSAIPGMVAAFQKFALWKRSRGITTRVVTITDIVAGRYGSFRAGARDLQEVIRRFLKEVAPRWGVSWLLLGGDIGVVPIRRVAGALEGGVAVAAVDPPADNTSFWTGSFLKMHVVSPGDWWGASTANQLVNPASGALIPYDGAGTSNATTAGWYFTTSNSYATRTTMATNFVRVNGPAGRVNADLQFLYQWNTLPTDLYYASLTSFVIAWHNVSGPFGLTFQLPYVYFPPHDWDALNNGLYGQCNGAGDLGGVVLATQLSVGRAPVDSAAQAEAFVAKVIAYESFRSPATGASLDGNWPRRVLLASSDWGGPTRATSTAAFPPGDGLYHHAAGSGHALIKLAAAPGGFAWDLIAEVTPTDRRLIPYDQSAAEGGRGWHFARSASDLRANGLTIPLPIIGPLFFPLPSAWIVVYGSADEVSAPTLLLDGSAQDGSMSDQEQLRVQLRTELPGWDTVSRLYEDEFDLTPAQAVATPVQHLTADRLRNALNAAPHIMSLSGHGNSNGCCEGSVPMASALTNGYHAFIGYADSCLTNQVDADDAFSEALLCNPNGGAVAYVGNTRFSWIGVGDNFQRAFFHRLTAVRQIGLLNDSRLGLFGASGYDTRYERWAIFALNLLGDPEMQVYRSRQPRRFGIRVSDRVRNDPFVVHVVEVPPPTPVPHPEPPPYGVLVYLRQGDLVRSARTDASGEARFDLADFGRGPIEVTASHDDFVPQQVTATPLRSEWVRGSVVELTHREPGPDSSRVRLRVAGAERWFDARAERGDYRLILDALENAFVSRQPIALCVDSPEDGGVIERFRFSEADAEERAT